MLTPGLPIGRLAERLGVSEHVLRVWERRYGLFRPERTPAGYRLYGEPDVRRGQAVLRLRDQGASVAEAARLALLAVPIAPVDGVTHETGEVVAAVLAAVDDFDQPALTRTLDGVAHLPLAPFVEHVALPVLRGLDSLAAGGPPTVAHTRLGAEALRTALLERSARRPAGAAAQVWLACPARESHDLALLAFGLLLLERGLRVRFLGANTPLLELTRAARLAAPDAVVLAVTRRGLLRTQRSDLAALAAATPVWLAGPGAGPALATGAGARHLAHDVVTGAATFDPGDADASRGAVASPEAGHH